MKYTSFLFMTLLFVTACGAGKKPAQSTSGQTAVAKLPKVIIDGVQIDVEIVQNPEERAQGLMHREELPENQGMLFVFQIEQRLSFWMRNTFIPLDIAFINAKNEIVDIQKMKPLDESRSYVSRAPALYALETNVGWFERNGLKVGAKVQF